MNVQKCMFTFTHKYYVPMCMYPPPTHTQKAQNKKCIFMVMYRCLILINFSLYFIEKINPKLTNKRTHVQEERCKFVENKIGNNFDRERNVVNWDDGNKWD